MGFTYMKSRLVQLRNPYSTLCLNKIVSLSQQYMAEKTIGISNLCNCSSRYHVLSSVICFYGLNHINSRLLLGCGSRFYHANRYPLQVYTPLPLQVYIPKIISWWQWPQTRKFFAYIKICIILTILFANLERVPYSNRIHMVTSSDKLEGLLGQHLWKRMEKKYQGRILPATHPQSIRVQSILREIVQGMHSGLVLKHEFNVSGYVPKSEMYGSQGTLLVSRVHPESQKRPKKSIIKFGTRHLEGLNWEVMVVESYQDNAEFLQNGKIVIYRGMLDHANSDAEIAYVLGHEVGHGVARHVSEHFMRVLWTVFLTSAFLNWLQLLIISRPVFMYISRRRELEADYIGLMLMASAGYDPQVAPIHYIFDDSEEDWLSTHPSGERRARMLNENKVMGEALAIYEGVRSGERVKCFV